jgi:26S proteasome regulatory subunit N8
MQVSKIPNHVIVHPLVLLSVVDHYTRTHSDKTHRAVGILLGSVSKGVVDITNSFAGKFFKKN